MSLFFDRAGLIAELRTSNLSSAIQEKVVQQARAAIAFKRCLRDMEWGHRGWAVYPTGH